MSQMLLSEGRSDPSPTKFHNFLPSEVLFSRLCRTAQMSLVSLQLRIDPVVNPVRVPPFDRVHGNSIEQHGEMQVVAPGQAG